MVRRTSIDNLDRTKSSYPVTAIVRSAIRLRLCIVKSAYDNLQDK